MSEVRLIDANRMKEHVAFQKDILANMGKDMEEIGNLLVNMINEEIDLQPTVDAVTVTRCEQCKWCEYPAHNSTGYACKLFDRCVKWDWFCADGERR